MKFQSAYHSCDFFSIIEILRFMGLVGEEDYRSEGVSLVLLDYFSLMGL